MSDCEGPAAKESYSVKDVNWKLLVTPSSRDGRLDDEIRLQLNCQISDGANSTPTPRTTLSVEMNKEGLRKLHNALDDVQSKLDNLQQSSSGKK